MSEGIMNIIIPAVVGVVSSFVTFFIAKGENSKDLTINDRTQLSEDEKHFRTELKEIVTSYKTDLEESRLEIRGLRDEVASLHRVNVELMVENRQLHIKVDELRGELRMFKQTRRNP